MYNYEEFSQNLLTEKLILESKLEVSETLMEILSMISDDRISREILRIVSSRIDREFTSNYLDISKDRDEYIEVIPSNKAERILGQYKDLYKVSDTDRFLKMTKKTSQDGRETFFKNQSMFDLLSWEPTQEDCDFKPSSGMVCKIEREAKSPISGKIYCLISFLDETNKNFEPTGIQRVINKEGLTNYSDNSLRVWTDQRSPIKAGKLAKTLLATAGIEFTAKEIENFSTNFKKAWLTYNNIFTRFDLVSGPKIAFWYKSRNYKDQSGTLGNSCMKEKPDDYFDIYTKNPEVCRLLIMYDEKGKIEDGKYKSKSIIGRALVWTLVGGKTFMDRIYYIDEKTRELFKEYSKQQGWYYKNYQDSDNDFYFVTPSGQDESQSAKATVNLGGPPNVTFNKYPYMDTMCYVNVKEGSITNFLPKTPGLVYGDVFICRSTSGGYDKWRF